MTTTGARGVGAHQDNPPTSRSLVSGSSGDDSGRSSRLTSTTPTQTTSPDTLLTPTRGRSTSRYPESLGRVPLHRRGTSKTYERLEDLLREAGYKETRVFTPEAERNAKSAKEKQESDPGHGVRAGVGAVVDFFAGLVSRGSSVSRETPPVENGSEEIWSPPPSPSLRTIHAKDKNTRPSSTISLSHNGSSDNLQKATRTHIDLSTDVPPKRTHAYHVVQRHQSAQGLPHQPYSHLKPHHYQYHHHHRHHHHHHLNNYSSKSSMQPNPPNARAYLRHMASAPNIQPLLKQPSLSEMSLRSHALGRENKSSTRRTLILNDGDSIIESDYEPQSRRLVEDNEHEAHLPMPRNWLESVTKALLAGSGGSGAVMSDSASVKTSSTRKSSTLSDKSNHQTRGRGGVRGGAGGARPPLLCVQVQDMKAKTIKGQVSCTSVMCRSAPTSRASSRVRGGTHDDRHNGRNRTRRRGEVPARDLRPRGKERSSDIVPSLAKTKVENDDWMAPRYRYLGGWGMDAAAISHPDGASSDESEEDDEDEGELGLDRLLVPARRQHSIQSLRRHLQRPRSQALIERGMPPPGFPRSGRASPFGGGTVTTQDLEDSSWGTNRGREWLASQTSGDAEEEGHTYSRSEVGSGRSSTKWRRGIPGTWAQWTTAS